MADDTPRLGDPDGLTTAVGTGDSPREIERQLAAELAAARVLQRISTRLISEQDPDTLYSHIVDAAMEIMGSDAASIQLFDPSRNALELLRWTNIHPDSAEFWRWVDASSGSACGDALRERTRFVVSEIEDFSAFDGHVREYRCSGIRSSQSTPLNSRSGRPLGMLSTLWRKPHQPLEQDFALFDALARQAADLIERAQIEAAVRQSEARNAFLLRLGDTLRPLSDAVSILEQATGLLGEYLDVDRSFYVEADTGKGRYVVRRDHVRGTTTSSLAGVYPVEDWPLITRALESGEPIIIPDTTDTLLVTVKESENLALLRVGSVAGVTLIKHGRFVAALVVTEPGARQWTSAEVDLINEVAERTWAALERANAEQRQKLLLAELQHRVRNILATVRSIIQRSAQTSDTLEDLSMHLEGRIDSMARTQVVLTRNPGVGVDLEDLVREELLSQIASEGQVSIDGPEIRLPPKAAEVLNLAIHELATNSIKYGAMRDGKGRVAIAWTIRQRGVQSRLRFAWIESGVKVLAAAPRREGFGSELITRRVPYELGGEGTFELKPGGIHCIIEFPLAHQDSILETEMRGAAQGGKER